MRDFKDIKKKARLYIINKTFRKKLLYDMLSFIKRN